MSGRKIINGNELLIWKGAGTTVNLQKHLLGTNGRTSCLGQYCNNKITEATFLASRWINVLQKFFGIGNLFSLTRLRYAYANA